MKTFVYLIRPARQNFMETMTEEEEALMEAHFNYLEDLLSGGHLILAGPALDAAFGIVIFEAEEEEEARLIVENDPAVRNRVMTPELHPYKVSLKR